MIEAFMRHHAAYNGVKPKRVARMGAVLRDLEQWAGCPAHEVTPAQFEQWMSSRLLNGLARSTVELEGKMVRVYFRWCWRNNKLDGDSMLRLADVPLPSVPIPEPRPYDRRELERFWRELEETYPNSTPRQWKRWRNGTSPWRSVWRESIKIQTKAVAALALDCGLRKMEIYGISIDDMHPDNEFVVVRKGKGDRYREVPMIDSTREAIHSWLDLRHEIDPGHDSPWLLLDPRVTRYATPLDRPSERSFSRTFSKVGRGWEFHRFRHTCATEWLRAGMRLEDVSRLMGHSQLQQTLRYAKLVNTDIHRSALLVSDKFTRAVRPKAIHTGKQQEAVTNDFTSA